MWNITTHQPHSDRQIIACEMFGQWINEHPEFFVHDKDIVYNFKGVIERFCEFLHDGDQLSFDFSEFLGELHHNNMISTDLKPIRIQLDITNCECFWCVREKAEQQAEAEAEIREQSENLLKSF